ncbi:MAG: segregation/condensation protein A [Oscillospiraceae bacterium]|nr:segregation/condensation protein A [Oscillospiraceae bacterium]
MDMTFSLAQFEGPLDLLLALISKNKMNIYDIRIMELIDQYLAIVNEGKNVGIEATSEFVEMAARLIYMKSVFLLPRNEEQERLKEELTGQLIEYSACKAIAAKLGEMNSRVFFAVRAPMAVEFDNEYNLRHDPVILRRALITMQGRSVARREVRQEQFEPLVSAPVVSVSSRIIHLLRNLVRVSRQRLQSFFGKKSGRSELVATFLAVLELVRAGRVTIDEEQNLCINTRRRRDERSEEEAAAADAAALPE